MINLEKKPRFNLDKSKIEQMAKDNQLDPPPVQIDLTTNKCMWEIEGYKIWADSYGQALQLLDVIKKF